MTTFIRLLDVPVDDKAAALKAALTGDGAVFDCDPEAFVAVPGSPFAYWTSDALRMLFRRHPKFENNQRTATRGASTCDDFRYVRLWTEVAGRRDAPLEWRPFTKGGCFSPFYAPIPTVVDWNPMRGTFNGFVGRPGRWLERPEAVTEYFKPALTWPLRGVVFSAAAVPRGSIFSVGGKVALAPESDLPCLLALFNNRPFDALLRLRAGKVGGVQYEVGLIKETPVPSTPKSDAATLSQFSGRAWSHKRALDTSNEISHAFLLPSSVNESITGLDRGTIELELESLQCQIDEAAFALYGLGSEATAIEASARDDTTIYEWEADDADLDVDETHDDEATGDASADALTSWLIGVVFARFDPRLATRERPIPPEPEPFDSLPARSPGMYPEGEEPADRPDVFVDDQGHANDLAARAQAVAERVKIELPENLRCWLAKDFFPLHIRMYSKSRRKAPIYWQLATPSASYSVWLYIHAFSKDTLFRVQNDYVAPKLAHEERCLEALTLELREGATATERKDLAEQQTLLEELRGFLSEVKRVAPLWNPDLNDGVIINFAPLWRLVPQNKAWQKQLKSTWDSLCEGKYDWAHLATHLWPERVVPKCAKDRSLAIAHDLENVFWEEDDDGKWRGRVQGAGFRVQGSGFRVQGSGFRVQGSGFRVQEVIDQLVAERTSAAVKDALQSLLDAPPPATGRGGGRRASGRGSAARTRGTTGRQRSGASATPDPAVMDSIKQALQTASDGASKADVLAATGLSDAQWIAAIAALLADGSVTKSGADRGTRYHRKTDD